LVAAGIHRVLQGLHSRRLPRWAVRSAIAPGPLPLSPVDVRRRAWRQAHLRTGRRRPAATAHRDRLRRVPRRPGGLLSPGRPCVLAPLVMRRTANVVAAPVVLGAVLGGCGSAHQSIVNAKGSEAQRIAGVWWLMFGLAAAVYVIVAGFILVGAFRGRRTETG